MATKKHEDQMSFVDEFDWKHGRGGKRTGAGRKASAVKTKGARAASFEQQIEEYKRSVAEKQ
ncbi:hypothetical protein [Vibrio sp. 3-2(1)]|jgi:hypothetical protein|uniref:hypothetical protein n=1 Tax=Vibrio sp. 3-2(1) TaxID=2591016 RepID=UPI001481D1AB|nr:hypothetical protein [Vibrio sp. 3-2(1)]NNN70958.1 hypothetical protein [Vibrio sp. 3-2(1)]